MEPRTPTLVPPAPARPPLAAQKLERDPGWRSQDVLRAAALVIALYVGLQLLWFAHELVFLTFLGVLFGLAVSRGADRLERFRIPRSVGASLIVFGFVGLLILFGSLAAPTLRGSVDQLQQKLPEALNRVETWLDQRRTGLLGQLIPGPAQSAENAAARPQPGPQSGAPPAGPRQGEAQARETGAGNDSISSIPGNLSGQLGAVTRYLFSFLSSTIAVLGGVLLILFLAIYIAANPGMYKKGLLHLVPHRARPRAREGQGWECVAP